MTAEQARWAVSGMGSCCPSCPPGRPCGGAAGLGQSDTEERLAEVRRKLEEVKAKRDALTRPNVQVTPQVTVNPVIQAPTPEPRRFEGALKFAGALLGSALVAGVVAGLTSRRK